MKSNHAADDRQLTRKALVNRGIEQACRRRLSSGIRSGVRVKVRGKSSPSSEPRNSHANDHMQLMLKRLWMESETSALTVDPSLKRTLGSSLLRDVGIQTTSISYIDRQTSCELPSFTSQSETTRSDENSSQSERSSQDTLSTSATSTSVSEDEKVYASHRRNHNRNNNAVEIVETNESVAVTCQASDRSYKQRFLTPFFHLFSLLRLSSLRSDRTTNNDRPAGSRCRRSTARPRPLPPNVPCPEERPASIDFISNALVSMEQQQKQGEFNESPHIQILER